MKTEFQRKLKSSRRSFIKRSVSALCAGVCFGRSTQVFPSTGALESGQKSITEDTQDIFNRWQYIKADRIVLKIPARVDKGNSIPVFIAVDSPMQPCNHVETIILLAEENPEPEVFRMSFTLSNDRADASTRISLAKTQKLVAVAKMNDGSLFTTSKTINIATGQ